MAVSGSKNFNIEETFKKASKVNSKMLKSYSSIKGLNFIEFPEFSLDFLEMSKMFQNNPKAIHFLF